MNIEKLNALKANYLEAFDSWFSDHEFFKWKAFKTFEDNWDINTNNIVDMISKSFSGLASLISGPQGSSVKMLTRFAEVYPEFVREAFINLYDESIELTERVSKFVEKFGKTEEAKKVYGTLRSLQTPKAAMTYLLLKYPNKYYLYEFTIMKSFDRYLEINEYKSSKPLNRIKDTIVLCDAVKKYLFEDSEFMNGILNVLNKNGYDGKYENILVNDFIFFVSKIIESDTPKKEKEEDVTVKYWLYAPGDNANKWDEFYDKSIMGIGWPDLGDLSNYESQEDIQNQLMEIYGDESNQIMCAHILWDFYKNMKPGDIVFVKKGRKKVVGRGVVEGDYYFDDNDKEYKNIRKIKWINKGEWDHPGDAAIKTLTDISFDLGYCKKLMALFDEKEELEVEKEIAKYTKEDFLKDAYMTESEYDDIVYLINNKFNVIFQGAPGVGKTYISKRLAFSIIGEKDNSAVEMVQFHQSYSYEDFIMGYKPTNDGGFEMTSGIFYDFCKRAEEQPDKTFFFIIDEINRGNLSKIFGEVFSLVEKDKRGKSIRLTYTDKTFSVPANIRLIGLMNTADRSLAMIDYALRRRFAFRTLNPAFESDGFKNYLERVNNAKLNNLIKVVKKLNEAISEDATLGKGYAVGHSFFCELENDCSDRRLEQIVKYEIVPLLEEYWFDEPNKCDEWTTELLGAIK